MKLASAPQSNEVRIPLGVAISLRKRWLFGFAAQNRVPVQPRYQVLGRLVFWLRLSVSFCVALLGSAIRFGVTIAFAANTVLRVWLRAGAVTLLRVMTPIPKHGLDILFGS